MKSKISWKKKIAITLASIFTFVALIFLLEISIVDTGIGGGNMRWAGQIIVGYLEIFKGFPMDDDNLSRRKYHEVFDAAEVDLPWRNYLEIMNDLYETYAEERRGKYYSPSIWTIVKNLPENPPPNVIVLVSCNIDPASLRTRLSDEDMQKRIRFIPCAQQKKFPSLKGYGALIRADGEGIIVNRNERHLRETTYEFIYHNYGSPVNYCVPPFDAPTFDLTTNLVDGLQVKYLMPDGKEVIPTND